MKRALCALTAFIIIFVLTSCGIQTVIPGDAATDYRASSNITSGAARVAAADGKIYVSSGSGGIYVIDPDKDHPAGYDIESDVFKAGEYGDICFFGGMIYALRSGSGGLDEIVAIDPGTGAEKLVKAFSEAEKGSVWFSDLIGDVLYVWVNGSINSLDASGTFRDTGLRDTLMITGKGSYVRAYEKDGFSMGLVYVPDDRKGAGTVEYAELKDRRVSVYFRYGGRVYIAADNRPAFIEAEGKSTKVTYINGFDGIPGLNEALFVGLNYTDTPESGLVCSVVGSNDGSASEEYPYLASVYSVDPSSGKTEEIFRKPLRFVPLCWISVIGDEIFASGIGDTTEWIPSGGNAE